MQTMTNPVSGQASERTAGIDFWISFGCPFTYMSVMRAEAAARASGIAIRWRPFSNRPNEGHLPTRCALAAQWDEVNRIALVGVAEGWVGAFARAVYRRWAQLGLQPGSVPNIVFCLQEIGQDPERVLALAAGAEIDDAYEATNDEAGRLGVFGSPTFAAGGKLFWSDDRLCDAIAWQRRAGSAETPVGSVRTTITVTAQVRPSTRLAQAMPTRHFFSGLLHLHNLPKFGLRH